MAHPEALLISSTIRTQRVDKAINHGVRQEWFHAFADEWKWIENYYLRHRRPPSRQAFKTKFDDFAMYKVDDVDHYVEEVRDSHARYVLTESIETAVSNLGNDQDVRNIIKHLQESVVKLDLQVQGSRANCDLVGDWDETYQDVLRRVERSKKKGLPGVPTGFPTLDDVTGGQQPGDLWIVAARLGQGKTWSMIRMACAALYDGLTTDYHALEQSRTQIEMRCHAFLSSKYGKQAFTVSDLMNGKNFSLLEYKDFLRDLRTHVKGKMHVSDTSRGRVTPSTIASFVEATDPDIVFVDYLTLMDTGEDWRDTARLSAGMKQIAQRYQIPVTCAAQINRSGVGKEPPGPETLSQSDSIGQDADAVVTMKQMSASVVKMRLAKYRHGKDNITWWCRFLPNTGHYEEITTNEAIDAMDKDRDEEDNR